jgi:hypothetical protein
MAFLIVNSTNQVLAYPATLLDARKNGPNVSVMRGITLETLDQESADRMGVRPVTPTPPPEYDPITQHLRELVPYQDEDGIWHQQWSVTNRTEEEIAAYLESQKPGPDWDGLQLALLNSDDMEAIIAAALPIRPLAAAALPTLLDELKQGADPTRFAVALGKVLDAAQPSAEVIEGLAAIARDNHLPEELIALLFPAEPPSPGQQVAPVK